MTDYEKDEFWRALGRLYDSTVALHKATEELRKIAEGHEKRLDRVEILDNGNRDQLQVLENRVSELERRLQK